MKTPYRLIGRIEAGELADLYKASQESGGDVVVKLFHPKTSDPAYARALADTSRVLNPLNHTGIVHTVDMGFVKQRLAVVREHVDGYTLGTALQRLNTKEVLLPAPIALYLVIQLLETVQKAHEAEIVHGAITPGNALLSREGLPGICDFGALKALMAVPELKRAFATRGRSAYRAPEVSKGEEPTAQSDIYSLGSIAYELLTLREAIVTGGGVSTRSGGLPPPSRIDRRINSRLDPIILRAVDPFPNRRYRSAGEFSGALRNFFAANGGMPGTEDLRRFVRELVPNEVSLSTLGPAPFTEPFTLTPVSGAEIAHLHAEAPEVSVVARISFSRSVSEEEFAAETQEAAPVFEEYKPENYAPLEATRAGQPEPVAEKEDTSPSSVGPLEQSWEAPPGAAPQKPRKVAPLMGTPGPKEGTFVGRNPRLKWVGDLSEEKTHIAEELQEQPSAQPAPKAAPAPRAAAPAPSARPPPSLVRSAAPKEPKESSAGYVHRDRPEIPMPPPTEESLRAVGSERRLFTEERVLRAVDQRKRQALGIAGGLALVGVAAFALAVWQFGPTRQPKPAPPKPVDPRAVALSGAVNQYVGSSPTPKPSEPKSPEPKSSQSEPSTRKDPSNEPRPDANSSFLTLRTNLPARVTIDGTALSRRTPLVKYPVKPGNRAIVLEAVGTKQRVEFNMRFERGKNHTVEQMFDSTTPGR